MIWMIFSVVIFTFPTTPAPGVQGMNYMIVVFGGWIALCLVYYLIPVYGGATWFNGPQVTIQGAALLQPEHPDGAKQAESAGDGEEKNNIHVAATPVPPLD